MAAKKKSVKKKAAKKKVSKKKVVRKKAPVRKASAKSMAKTSKKPVVKKVRATKRKFRLVAKNLILFIILSLLSFLLYNVSSDQMYRDFFSLLTWILGFIAVAFFIVLLILFFLKVLKK